ncbi:MAG TPA: TonB-dependent receptor [Eudoraea sp.]|nr:TonB-dependent receptor [Eudoraea sp.]
MKNIVFLFAFCFLTSSLWSQNGNVQGTIIDDDGIAISGATIVISTLNRGTVSDLDGKFTLLNIPTGTYVLTITYLGFSDLTRTVDIKAGKSVFLALALNPEGIRLSGVEVYNMGSPRQIRALNTQKNNVNITNVVSTDQIGKFPDSNIGDAVKRIPGIAMQVDQGEARNIIIRGLSPELNSVLLNGSRIPSAEGDNRNVQLDLIPSDMIQTIEVNKTLTPDMDADALGGAVHLITRTAPQGFRLAITGGSGFNMISNKRIWSGAIVIGNRSNNGKFGWMVSSSINDNDYGSDTIEARWADSFSYNTGNTDPNGDPVLQQVSTNPYARILEIQPLWIQRIRRSLAANFEYQWNDHSTFFLKTMYNWRDDKENKFVFDQEILASEDISLDDFTIEGGNLIRFPVLAGRQTLGGINSNRSKNAQLEDLRMQNYSLGGIHLLGNTKLDWSASFFRSSDTRNKERIAEFKNSYEIRHNPYNQRFPLFIPEISGESDNPANFAYDEIIEENKFTAEEDHNFFVNVAFPGSFIEKWDGTIKIGLRGRLKSKLRNNNFLVFEQEENFPTLLDTPTQDYTDPGYLVGSQYRAGQFADANWLGTLDLAGGNSVPDEFLKQNFTVDENVFAGYLMFQQNLSDKLNVLAGIRLEHTLFKANANRIVEGSGEAGQIKARERYGNLLPGIHFKYTLSDQTIFRLAWTKTLSRPNYVDMVPTSSVVFSDREILLGNASLAPAVSSNFDMIAEHYLKSVGLLSAGIFSKNIKNFVYTFRSTTMNEEFGPGTTGFNLLQPLNGEEASLYGFELSFQQKLDFLPGFAKYFTIDTNYTYLRAKTEGIRDVNGVERDDLDLSDSPPHLFNASLGYEGLKFTARLSANFSDGYIIDVGGRAFEDIYYDHQFFLDFSAGYILNKNLRLYAGLNNITNQPLRLYQGTRERTAQLDFYVRTLSYGLKYDVFEKRTLKDIP